MGALPEGGLHKQILNKNGRGSQLIKPSTVLLIQQRYSN